MGEFRPRLTFTTCADSLFQRQGLFFSAASIAGAFSGLLAYAIVNMNGVGGEAGWRWMCATSNPQLRTQKLTYCSFILEGILTVLVAFASFFLLYDFPDTASFLTLEERA